MSEIKKLKSDLERLLSNKLFSLRAYATVAKKAYSALGSTSKNKIKEMIRTLDKILIDHEHYGDTNKSHAQTAKLIKQHQQQIKKNNIEQLRKEANFRRKIETESDRYLLGMDLASASYLSEHQKMLDNFIIYDSYQTGKRKYITATININYSRLSGNISLQNLANGSSNDRLA